MDRVALIPPEVEESKKALATPFRVLAAGPRPDIQMPPPRGRTSFG